MNKIHKQRLIYVSLFTIGLAIATGLILFALKKNINVFVTPNQLATAHFATDYHFRLGGMVKPGSVVRDKNSLDVAFVVTDFKNEITVHYSGVIPDLFREGKGVIAEGNLNSQHEFNATQILAKHDENYMPNNIYKQIKNNEGRLS